MLTADAQRLYHCAVHPANAAGILQVTGAVSKKSA
jgi:hypothetical protein